MILYSWAIRDLVQTSKGGWRERTSIVFVHLRRALLLFAIVLGLAAIAASVARPPEKPSRRAVAPSGPIAPGAPAARATVISFDATRDQVRRLARGRPATVLLEVDEPGLAEIPSLGLSAPADPHTPAHFEVLVRKPGRFPIAFKPAVGDEARQSGRLVVTAAGE